MCRLIVADQWTKACSSPKCYSDLQSLLASSSELVTGIQQCRVCGAGSVLSAQGWAGWIPVTSTGMRKSNKTPRVARISTGLRKVSQDCNLSSVLIHVLVTGMRAAPRLRRGKRSFSPRTWSGWLPVTSTGMRRSNKPPRVARISTALRKVLGDRTLSAPHPCACHRDPAAPRLRRGKRSFSPRTWAGWIPVTSTGMRKSNKPPRI